MDFSSTGIHILLDDSGFEEMWFLVGSWVY